MGVVLMRKSFSIMLSLLVFAVLLVPVSVFAHKPVRSCVTLYEHINFKGQSIRFCQDEDNLLDYKNNRLQFGKKNWNDVASSAKVEGYRNVDLYEHINYKGKRWTLKRGSYSDFTKKHHHGKSSWNDIVSSINIR
jgi:hypothetical protein